MSSSLKVTGIINLSTSSSESYTAGTCGNGLAHAAYNGNYTYSCVVDRACYVNGVWRNAGYSETASWTTGVRFDVYLEL